MTMNNTALVIVEDKERLLADFMAFLDVSTKSITTYRKALHSFFNWASGKYIRFSDISREDLLSYKRGLVTQGLKSTTITLYIVAVRRFYSWLEEKGQAKNIAKNVKGEKISKEHKKDCLTVAQVRKVLSCVDTKTIQGRRDYAILLLAVTTGLRTIEMQRANIDDIKEVSGQRVLFIQGKGKSDKADYVKLSPKVEKVIADYLKLRASGKSIDSTEPLFIAHGNRSSERLHIDTLSRLIKRAFKRAKINSDRITAHSLRHTAATLNLLHGGSLEETQSLLRHQNISTTMIYTHHISKMKNMSEERIEKAIL